ncbi:ArsC family transcriptional regulator [Bombiscardovia coagulans]|uniref:ArsC family transcriptional regulator n=2 Tax=Bombiscardovia coagulans TaxID=686666 RepID=A0A261EP44_9BIFI|nr:ArsC family transcriptional regulator [Bombiscardovia coagulans]
MMNSDYTQLPLFMCYSRCSTCAKARKWLENHDVQYTERDIKENRPTYSELKDWFERSGLPIKRFFNTSGQSYRKLDTDHRPESLTVDESLHLLATDGMLVKRPILVDQDQVLVGFRLEDWERYYHTYRHTS